MSDSTPFKPRASTYAEIQSGVSKVTEERQQPIHREDQEANTPEQESSLPPSEPHSAMEPSRGLICDSASNITASTAKEASAQSGSEVTAKETERSIESYAPPQRSEEPMAFASTLLELGKRLDANAKAFASDLGSLRCEMEQYRKEILSALSRELELKEELAQAKRDKQSLEEQAAVRDKEISRLSGIEQEFVSLVPDSFQPLLDALDPERKGLVRALLNTLCEFTKHGANAQLLPELTVSLGATLHQTPQLSEDLLDDCVDALNQLFQRRADILIGVRRVRCGDPIEPSLMDGSELQGKQSVAEVKNWAVLSGEKIVRRAQISGI